MMKLLKDNALFVFPTHAQEWEHNKGKLLEANVHFPIAKISCTSKGIHA